MLAEYMTKQDFTVSRIHGDQTHDERKRVVNVCYMYIHTCVVIL